MRRTVVIRMAIVAVMAALYFVLAFLKISIGNIRITPASIAIVIIALLYSPGDAIMVAFVGEFLQQLVGPYGITPTLPLWLIPPMIRAAIISLTAYFFRRNDQHLEDHYVIYFITVVVAAIHTTGANTGIIYLDAFLLDYPVAYVQFETLFRFISGMITAIIVGALSIPVVKALRKLKIGQSLTKSEKEANEKLNSPIEEPNESEL